MIDKNIKRLISVLIISTLYISCISCGKEKEITTEPSTKIGDNALEIGARETAAIKQILENNEVEITDSYDWSAQEDLGDKVYVSKDADHYYLKDVSNVKGYEVWPKNFFMSNEDSHYYLVWYSYGAFMRDNKPIEKEEDDYSYYISFMFPNEENFCIENFHLLVDLVKIHCGDEYDVESLEAFIRDQIEKADKDILKEQPDYVDSRREVGDHEEVVSGGYIGSGYERDLFPTNRKEMRRIAFSIRQIIEYREGVPKIKSTN